MIAAEKNRNVSGSRDFIATPAQRAGPALDFPIVIGLVRRSVGKIGHAGDRDIAMVGHRKAQALEHSQQTGGAQRRRAHQGAALRRAHVDGSAKQRD
jgi:hypothetical protein